MSLVPNGPLAATAHMVISQFCVHAPLNVNLIASEMAFEFSDLPADAIVVQKGEAVNALALQLAAEMNKPVIELVPSASELGCFTLRWLERRELQPNAARRAMGARGDLSLIVHTSGTTNKPKIVPLTHENVACDVLINPLALSESDTCLNMSACDHRANDSA
jgi:acyl-coenzyme A synthetase/AMP-(fatty) acid ligase